ncbi:Succinate dehydrogenase 2-3 [Hibiscus syriacus]|uniref:Succinate dehydrogenase 2-3 n=2 Tax=Hibiscus syriacus TaxID=106335 RepID=A0A6A2XX97_HIBSY|nr:Succinate dehydrogenase 2-3 [Hibiscus syriacus]
MDSGNSGSVQSSSCGSEEFDSRADSISAFFNSNPSTHICHGPSGIQPPPLMQPQRHSPSSMLIDPLSSYFDHPLSSATNPNSQLNLDSVWSKNIRSEPNCNDLGGGFMASQQAQSGATFSSVQIPQGPESGTKASVSGTTDQPANTNMVRNSKKRSRASWRAPTTVLTTDTSNFRAMVQEFTGIPAPPFTSSPFPRTRLDLFGTTQLDPCSPHYLLRPFAQKLQYPPPFMSSSTPSSSMVDAIASTPSTIPTFSTTSINYQLPSELGLSKQLPQNPLNNNNSINMQNLMLNLFQAPPKYPISDSIESFGFPSNESALKMGVFEELGLSQGHGNTNLGGVQNMVPSSDIGPLPRNENSAIPSSWGESTGIRQYDRSLLRSINGSYNSNTQKVLTNGDFYGDKGSDSVATKSEGMAGPWICSSE